MDIELTLTALTYGGDALGRDAQGRAVFVPYALPGETVRVRVVEEKKNFIRAQLLEIIQPSPQRIAPRCKHYSPPLSAATGGGAGVGCGGCHYQHLGYADQLKAKESILRDQLQRIGKIENPPVSPIVPSPREWHYRNHVQFHLDESGKLGFHAHGSNSIVAISECHLPDEVINTFWPQLDFEPSTPLERVSLRVGADDDLMLILESDDPQPPDVDLEAGISAVHLFDDHAAVIAGDDHIFIDVTVGATGSRSTPIEGQSPLQKSFRVSAASFFRVNTAMAEKMVQHLLAKFPLTPSTVLLDIYCGVGLFSAFCAERVARVIGIESSPSACEDFAVNLDAFDNVELYEAAAEDALPALKVRADIVILDPPRAGLDVKVVDALLALKPQTIAYVSCDPATLARDAARLLKGGYKLLDVTPFDLFPQTYHIESISLFSSPTKLL